MPRLTEYLAAYGACEEAIDYCQKSKSIDDAWDNCERADWMLWMMYPLGVHPEIRLKARLACLGRVRDIISKHSPLLGKEFADIIDVMSILVSKLDAKGIHAHPDYQRSIKTVFDAAANWPKHLPFVFPNTVFSGISIEASPTNASSLAFDIARLEEYYCGKTKEESLKEQSDICRSILSTYVKGKSKELGLFI